MKRELLIYLFTVLLCAPVIHPDLLSNPVLRLEMMSDRANYFHPFVFGFGVYLAVGLLRLVLLGLRKIIKR